jgi:hypothetical protein
VSDGEILWGPYVPGSNYGTLLLLLLCAYVEKARPTSGHHFVWMTGRQTRSMRITRKVQRAEINYVMSCNLNFLFLSANTYYEINESAHMPANMVHEYSPPALKWSVCRTNARKRFDSFIMKYMSRYFRLPKSLPISRQPKRVSNKIWYNFISQILRNSDSKNTGYALPTCQIAAWYLKWNGL